MTGTWRIIVETIALLALLFAYALGGGYMLFISDSNVLRSAYMFVIFLLAVKILAKVIYFIYTKQRKVGHGERNNFYFGINNIANVLIGMGFVVSVFNGFGVELRTLLTSLSIIAAAIAIITKDYFNDFLVGLYYSFSRNIEINDHVKIGGHKGKILEIEMLKIKLQDDNDDMVILPNSLVYASEIINYTKSDLRSTSVDFQLGIHVIEDIESFEEELKQTLLEFGEFMEEESFNLKIVDMKREHIDFKFSYRLKSFDVKLQERIRRKTIRKIYNHISSKVHSA